jgi:Nucleotidyltransferase of unknown function (DUF6036)
MLPDSEPNVGGSLPSPWKEFLLEIDSMLNEQLELHCIGGFVICFFYGLPRATGDVDYYTAIPANIDLMEVAGEGSALAKKYKICLHHVAIMTMPEDYATRLTEMFPGLFKHLRLYAPDPYDYILSKLERNSSKDRDDADYIFKTKKLNSQTLRERYERELRPNLANETRHDLTLTLWIGIFETESS